MAARAIWKATLLIGETEIPVKLYSAVQDRAVHFHLLHDQDLVRVKQRMVNPETDETVPHSEARKGYQLARNKFVMFEQDELEALQPKPSREIHIESFVPASAIKHLWYDRPYWLGPDGQTSDYFALARALENREAEGVARWVMRKKQYVGALRAEEGCLALITLRHAEATITGSELDPPEGRALEKRERELAGQLVAALEGEFDPAAYQDEYRERVRELIETKRAGGTIEVEEYEPPPEPRSLADSLRASLQRVS